MQIEDLKLHDLCPTHNIGAIGICMDGIIAWHALARRGSQSSYHHVDVFVSYDAPKWPLLFISMWTPWSDPFDAHAIRIAVDYGDNRCRETVGQWSIDVSAAVKVVGSDPPNSSSCEGHE